MYGSQYTLIKMETKEWPKWPQYGPEEQTAVSRVIKSNLLFADREVKSFEKQYASYIGCNYALGLGNGTQQASKAGHVNCKTGADFKGFMTGYFHHVFLFSMNDEVVHTGFDKMAHYLFCVCCGVK